MNNLAAIPDPNQPLPAGQAKSQAVRHMFDVIAPRYDLINRIMTFGLDERWRRRAVQQLELPRGSLVLDLACGTGDLCRDLTVNGHQAVGVDLSWGMLAASRTVAPLIHADALHLPIPSQSIDGVTCGFALRNLADLDLFLAEIARVLRPGGRIALLEVDQPRNQVLRFGHSLYFGRIVPLIGGLLSDRSAYRYLPRSVAYLPSETELLKIIEQAGFTCIAKEVCTGGIAQLLTANRI